MDLSSKEYKNWERFCQELGMGQDRGEDEIHVDPKMDQNGHNRITVPVWNESLNKWQTLSVTIEVLRCELK